MAMKAPTPEIARHGYFLALPATGHGDVELALRACELWGRFGFDKSALGPRDGVAIWLRVDGTYHARLVAPDFFLGLRLIRELDADTGDLL